MNTREKIVELIDSRFSGRQTDFARAVGRSKAQINGIVKGRDSVGDVLKRDIEGLLVLPAYFLDPDEQSELCSDKGAYEVRRNMLRNFIDSRFRGNATAFARAIDRAPAQVSHWLTGRRALGDAGCRHIELTFSLPPGYFNTDLDGKEVPVTSRDSLQDDLDLRILHEIKQLPDEFKLDALRMIQSLRKAFLAGGTK